MHREIQSWLDDECRRAGPTAQALVLVQHDQRGLVHAASWPPSPKQERRLASAAQAAFDAKRAMIGRPTKPRPNVPPVVSQPLVIAGKTVGAVAVSVAGDDPDSTKVKALMANLTRRAAAGMAPPSAAELGAMRRGAHAAPSSEPAPQRVAKHDKPAAPAGQATSDQQGPAPDAARDAPIREDAASATIRPVGTRGQPVPGAEAASPARIDRGAPAPSQSATKRDGRGATPSWRLPPLVELMRKLSQRPSAREGATLIATELAAALKCDRVSIGVRNGPATELIALSNSAEFNRKERFMALISAAIDEAIEQSDSIIYPRLRNSAPMITRAHAELLREGSAALIVTVPFALDDVGQGAFCFERSLDGSAPGDALATLIELCNALGPMLIWMRRRQTTTPALQLRRTARRLFGKHRSLMQLALIMLVAMLATAMLIPVHFRVTAPVRVEGSIQRSISAPSEGYIKAHFVRPGDSVVAGQPLLELDTEELALEQRKLQSEIAQFENGLGDALAKQDRAQIAVQTARRNEAGAKLALTEERIARAMLRAPFDGVVIQGDLSRSVGAPVKRGESLLTISPSSNWRLIAEVDERDIEFVSLNQGLGIVLAAMPETSIAARVSRVTPVAVVRDGRNFFEVETTPSQSRNLRPGMQGVAKLDAGQHAAGWVLTRRLIDWLRLQWWNWTI